MSVTVYTKEEKLMTIPKLIYTSHEEVKKCPSQSSWDAAEYEQA